MDPLLVGHLSDLHVVRPSDRLFGRLDTFATASQAVAQLNGVRPAPDVVIVTGDLTGHGDPGEYEAARSILDTLAAPYFVIPGNHDRRQPLLEAFVGHAWATPDGFVQYVVEDLPVRLVALDTVVEGHDDGLVCERRLDWLAGTLGDEPGRPTLLFLHHPPVPTGVWWMDTAGLAGAGALVDLLAGHPQVRLLAAGHIHRPIAASIGTARLAVAPSTAFAVHLDLTPESPPRAVLEPRQALLHVFGERFVVTHTVLAENGPAPIDVAPSFGEWPEVRKEWRDRLARITSS